MTPSSFGLDGAIFQGIRPVFTVSVRQLQRAQFVVRPYRWLRVAGTNKESMKTCCVAPFQIGPPPGFKAKLNTKVNLVPVYIGVWSSPTNAPLHTLRDRLYVKYWYSCEEPPASTVGCLLSIAHRCKSQFYRMQSLYFHARHSINFCSIDAQRLQDLTKMH